MEKIVQKFIARLLGATALILVLGFSTASSALEIDVTDESENGEARVGFDYLIANGEMMASDPRKIRAILEKRAQSGRRTVILFTSHGGYLEMLPSLANAVIRPSNTLFTKYGRSNLIVINEECSSACAALMALITSKRDPQALEVYVHPRAIFGFHSPMTKVGGRLMPFRTPELREAAVLRQLRFLKEAGVAEGWLASNESYFRQNKLTSVTARSLCDEQSLIIPPDACLPDEVEDTVTYIDALLAGPGDELQVPNLKVTQTPNE